MPLSQTDWTVEMVNALPDDGNRYEVIDGELFVTPAPAMVHQRAAAELYRMLAPYAKSLSLDIMMAPAAVTFSKRREVQPDLLVIPRKATGRWPRVSRMSGCCCLRWKYCRRTQNVSIVS